MLTVPEPMTIHPFLTEYNPTTPGSLGLAPFPQTILSVLILSFHAPKLIAGFYHLALPKLIAGLLFH